MIVFCLYLLTNNLLLGISNIMFEQLNALPADPLLGLMVKYRNDKRDAKIDLGVGIYKDASGCTPVLNSVKQAEDFLLKNEDSKSYVGPAGNLVFGETMTRLVFGEGHVAVEENRLVALQTPGGCGALRILAELIKRSCDGATVWVSDPTWANHIPLLGDAGLTLKTYPYYDHETHGVCFNDMQACLQQAEPGDVVLLHGCCHNPSGADLSETQWQKIIDLMAERKLIPLIDIAYQGFGESLEADAYGARLATERLPEVMVAVSCSKNFGLYRERVGCAFIVTKESNVTARSLTHLMTIARGIYSMPPSHGASIVATILQSQDLTAHWHSELEAMHTRIQWVRREFTQEIHQQLGSERFNFITSQKGMFSFLGISSEEVASLAENYGIYMADSSRVSLAGLNVSNLSYFCNSLRAVVHI